MSKFIFENCCGCIELRRGCLIIGYINLVLTTLMIITITVASVTVVGGVIDYQPKESQPADLMNLVVFVMTIIFLIFSVLHLTFIIVYLVGIHKNKRGHVKAYLVFNVICLVITFVLLLFQGINRPELIPTILSIPINIYFMLVIRSYYYKMREQHEQLAAYKP